MVKEKVKVKEKVEQHLGVRKVAPPPFPHMKLPGVSQKKKKKEKESLVVGCPHSCTTKTTVPPTWQGTYGKVVGVVPVVGEDVEAEA